MVGCPSGLKLNYGTPDPRTVYPFVGVDLVFEKRRKSILNLKVWAGDLGCYHWLIFLYVTGNVELAAEAFDPFRLPLVGPSSDDRMRSVIIGKKSLQLSPNKRVDVDSIRCVGHIVIQTQRFGLSDHKLNTVACNSRGGNFLVGYLFLEDPKGEPTEAVEVMDEVVWTCMEEAAR
ncbi:unnamed protein product [Clonostachys byssicola]|uniref:Uncharacterized protein n=1 Tax=Clonostachys byssicola TaxID=160290 RepID=A0A9N9UQB2_9HYPO|nr:unnamed protein product [Clonostachys byssicola]